MVQPELGRWYRPAGVEDLFRVLEIDERGTVTIQHFDGFVDSLDILGWTDLCPEEVPDVVAPEETRTQLAGFAR